MVKNKGHAVVPKIQNPDPFLTILIFAFKTRRN